MLGVWIVIGITAILLYKNLRGDVIDNMEIADSLRNYDTSVEEDRGRVKCEECKCLIHREDAQVVEIRSANSYFYSDSCHKDYYCKSHKKSFDFIKYDVFDYNHGRALKYFKKEVEVSEDGTPVGYTKIKNK